MIAGIDSRVFYLVVLAAVVVERLIELRLARRHARRLLSRGGYEVGARHYPWMVALHAAFLLACPLEVWGLDRPFMPPLGYSMLILLGLTMGLRYWVIHTLGERWTTRVIVVPGEERIVAGPYRFLRHPNYLAVIAEIVALALIHTAWASAILFTILNLGLLGVRVRVEDRALRAAATAVAKPEEPRAESARGRDDRGGRA